MYTGGKVNEGSRTMNANAKTWVAALRSGDFLQSSLAGLRPVEDTYSCLGVACDLYPFGSWYEGTRGHWGYQADFENKLWSLPRDVAEWLGLSSPDGAYDDGVLGLLREADGFTFDVIADVIEEEPEGLFVWSGGDDG